MSENGKKCNYRNGVASSRSPVDIYNTSQTCLSSGDDPQDSFPVDDDSSRINAFSPLCPGAANVGLCPSGFYCPTSELMIKCPSGYYCPRGTFEPVRCGFGKLTCPHEGDAYPAIFIPIGIIFSIFFSLVTVVYLSVNSRLARRRRQRREAQRNAVQSRRDKRKALEESLNAAAFGLLDNDDDDNNDDNGGDNSNHGNGGDRNSPQQQQPSIDYSTHSTGLSMTSVDVAANDMRGLEENALAQRLTIWLCCGCDVESHMVILVVTMALVSGAALIVNLVDFETPVFGSSQVRYGLFLLFASFSLFVISAFGVVYLSGRDAQPGFNPHDSHNNGQDAENAKSQ
jgi:hypothetical protein